MVSLQYQVPLPWFCQQLASSCKEQVGAQEVQETMLVVEVQATLLLMGVKVEVH